MQLIVQWCNENVGFVSAALTLATIILSIIAIIVAIKTARLPFKKSLKLSIGWTIGISDFDNNGISINAINTGNRAITINMMGLLIENKQLVPVNEITKNQKMLRPTDAVSINYRLEELRNALLRAGFNLNSTVYAYANDTEGKRYKKRIGKLKKFIRQINQ